jgi:hypothetical protein
MLERAQERATLVPFEVAPRQQQARGVHPSITNSAESTRNRADREAAQEIDTALAGPELVLAGDTAGSLLAREMLGHMIWARPVADSPPPRRGLALPSA